MNERTQELIDELYDATGGEPSEMDQVGQKITNLYIHLRNLDETDDKEDEIKSRIEDAVTDFQTELDDIIHED